MQGTLSVTGTSRSGGGLGSPGQRRARCCQAGLGGVELEVAG